MHHLFAYSHTHTHSWPAHRQTHTHRQHTLHGPVDTFVPSTLFLIFCLFDIAQLYGWRIVTAGAHARTQHTPASIVIDFHFSSLFCAMLRLCLPCAQVDDGSFLYQFSTCGVKYDLYSFVRFEQRSAFGACTAPLNGRRKETIESVNNAFAN